MNNSKLWVVKDDSHTVDGLHVEECEVLRQKDEAAVVTMNGKERSVRIGLNASPSLADALRMFDAAVDRYVRLEAAV